MTLIAASLQKPAVRFFLMSLTAFALDLILVLTLRSLTSLSLTVSVGIAFLSVGVGSYFVNEFWTFRREGSRADARRGVMNIAALAFSLVVRVTIVGLLETAHPPDMILSVAYLLTGAAASLSCNFLLSKFWVFR